MSSSTRRNFLLSASTAAAGALLLKGRRAQASPFGLPIGLQLYSVREPLAKDYEGTLQKVAACGYKEVESAGYFDHSAQQVRKAMDNSGLHLVSAHYSYQALAPDVDKIIAFNKELGVDYIICAFPGLRDPSRIKDPRDYKAIIQSFSMDDYRFNADQFNKFGEKAKAAGMKFGYHNHTMEFTPTEGKVPFDELVRLTDPKLVTFEMDCGWVVVGGGNPVDYLNKYPTRITMLHVKDFKPTAAPASMLNPPDAAELGHGTAKYVPIFAAAKKANIKHYFVEQEGYDMPMFEALKLDADYMKDMHA